MLQDTVFHWWHDAVDRTRAPCEVMESEDMLFLLYTSGSTGKPKGIVHTTGGYLAFVQMTARITFNLIPDSGQLFWWATGHSYVLYGILMNRVPTLMYEVTELSPDIEGRKGAGIGSGTSSACTGCRTSTLHHSVERCPIVDTYWQTETGGHICTPMPGAIATKPGSCTLAMLGIDAVIVNEQGEELPANKGGLFAIRKPWPGMLRGVFGNRERFVSNYFGRLKDPKTGQPISIGGRARWDQDGISGFRDVSTT